MQYVWSPAGGVVEQTVASEGSVYLLPDRSGNVTAVVGSDGVLDYRYVYSREGEEKGYWYDGLGCRHELVRVGVSEEGYGARLLYRTSRLNWSTGLYTFGGREYDPQTGQYLTPDPQEYLSAYVNDTSGIHLTIWRDTSRTARLEYSFAVLSNAFTFGLIDDLNAYANPMRFELTTFTLAM